MVESTSNCTDRFRNQSVSEGLETDQPFEIAWQCVEKLAPVFCSQNLWRSEYTEIQASTLPKGEKEKMVNRGPHMNVQITKKLKIQKQRCEDKLSRCKLYRIANRIDSSSGKGEEGGGKKSISRCQARYPAQYLKF